MIRFGTMTGKHCWSNRPNEESGKRIKDAPWAVSATGSGVPGLLSNVLKVLVKEDRDLLREIVNVAVQEMLEAEMDEALGAAIWDRDDWRTT